jgi:hypothetical protein
MPTNLAFLSSGFLGGLLVHFINDLIDFITKVFTGPLVLPESQFEAVPAEGETNLLLSLLL